MLRHLIAFLLITLLTQAPLSAAVTYSLTDLGDLGGGYSYGYAINEQGHATGVSLINSIDLRAFYWNGLTMQDLGAHPNGGGHVYGFDINNNNHIVGKANEQAFRWTPNDGMLLLDPFHFGNANDLNEGNSIVGQRVDNANSDSMLFSSTNNTIEINPGQNSRGSAINNGGAFVGVTSVGGYYTHLPGSPFITLPLDNPTDINDSRQIVGSVTGTAALYDFDSGTLTDIGRLEPTNVSVALGINNIGQVVGYSGNRGFYFDSVVGLQDVTQLLSPEHSGWSILSLDDINGKGQMIGVGRFNGVDHAVILTPVPEPGMISLSCLSAIGFAGLLIRRHRMR